MLLRGFHRQAENESGCASRACSRFARAVHAARQRVAGEEGFSLIELLVVIVVLPVVIGAISLAIVTVLQQQNSVGNRVSDSSASQFTSALYVRDVQSASQVTTRALSAACGSGSTFVLGLAWNGGQAVSSYWVTTIVGTPTTYQLVRDSCTSGVLKNSVTVGGIAAGQGPAVVTCASACDPSTGWISATGVSSVTLGLTQSASTFKYTLSGVPRAWSPAPGTTSGGGQPIPPLLLLGGSGQVLGLNGNGNSLLVNGPIELNSNSSGAVSITRNFNVLTATNFLVYGCAPSAGATCTNGAVSAPGNGNQLAQPVSTTTVVPDPLASLAPPPTPAPSALGCTPSGSNVICYPGTYTPAQTLAANVLLAGNNMSVTFNAGDYLFDGSALAFSGNGLTVTFGGGTYIFHNGVTVTGQGGPVLKSSGGVMFYIGNSQAPHDTGGETAALNFNDNQLSVTLSPLTTGAYAGILVFQNRLDAATMYMNGNNPGVFTQTGLIYAPLAAVQLTGNSTTITVGSFVCQSLILNGNGGSIVLGP